MRTLEQIAIDVLCCVTSWDPGVRIFGNVTARELATLAIEHIMTCPKCGAEAWCDIDCTLCIAMSTMEVEFNEERK